MSEQHQNIEEFENKVLLLVKNFDKNWKGKEQIEIFPNKQVEMFPKKQNEGCVYVLLLEEFKIYVGFTTQFKTRLKNHFNYPSTSFLKKYSPKKVISVHRNRGKIFENELTKFLLTKLGANQVRGGGWTQSDKYDESRQFIKKMQFKEIEEKE